MKRAIFTTLTVIAATIGNVSAQQGPRMIAENTAETAVPGSSDAMYFADTRAARSFKKKFGDVSEEKWYSTRDGQRIKFVKNGVSCMADYTNSGTFLQLIRTYSEQQLPTEVRLRVRSEYLDYNIFLVQELQIPRKETIYLVKIEDKTSWKTLRVSDQDIDELEVYAK
ncbi:hypothetical protein [Flavihumibacter petaseus]|uniref:Uncharacterized protein n=1 Tax=Flavihumibacter petaseus NBRC 106054 TaxID=1220578 RepID=A0A0E9MYI9_9BACT|nr:hypothetical protein [Flavihumibacter petaseus]GAO42573.1 hypothetical protein FPE01S_01_15880 [Flavihumibacter petaseus NBRC 106054]